MCVICYEFTDEEHWADAIVSENGAGRSKYRRTRILSQVLSPYGLTISDPGRGQPTVVANRKGASEVAGSLPSIWDAAQRLSGRSIDVLDSKLLEALAPAGAKPGTGARQ